MPKNQDNQLSSDNETTDSEGKNFLPDQQESTNAHDVPQPQKNPHSLNSFLKHLKPKIKVKYTVN